MGLHRPSPMASPSACVRDVPVLVSTGLAGGFPTAPWRTACGRMSAQASALMSDAQACLEGYNVECAGHNCMRHNYIGHNHMRHNIRAITTYRCAGVPRGVQRHAAGVRTDRLGQDVHDRHGSALIFFLGWRISHGRMDKGGGSVRGWTAARALERRRIGDDD